MKAYIGLFCAFTCLFSACAAEATPAPAEHTQPQLTAAGRNAAPRGGSTSEQALPSAASAAGAGKVSVERAAAGVAAVSSSATTAANAPQQTPAAASSSDCSERFTVATRASVEMSWPDTVGYLGGQGMLTAWSRTTHTRTANGTVTEVVACGVSLPVVTTSPLLDGVQLANEIPSASFDLPSMPRAAGSSKQEGDHKLIDMGVMLLGASLTDPNVAWPQRTQLQLVDHDADGKPGITAIPKDGAPYGLPPADVGQTEHVDAVYIASRIALMATTTDSLCADRAQGSVEPQGFDYTIVGCHVLGGDECKPNQVNLLDNNDPAFTLGPHGHWVSVPIAESASCVAVLAALPPE